MAYYNVQDPGLRQGFSALADAFYPDPSKVVNATLTAARREQAYADRDKTLYETDILRRQEKALSDLQGLMSADPNFAGDPHKRAQAAALSLGVKDGFQYGPRGLTGATVYANPNAFGPDLSNVLVGQGIQTWGGTPMGHAQGLANASGMNDADNARALEVARINAENDLAQQRLRNEAALSVAGIRKDGTVDAATIRANAQGGGRAPLAVTPKLNQQAWELVGPRVRQLVAENGEDPNEIEVDETLKSTILNKVGEEYQRTRNIEAAIQAVLGTTSVKRGIVPGSEGAWWNPFGSNGTPQAQLDPRAAAVEAGLGGQPTAPAAPTPQAQAQSIIEEGRTATNRQTGQKIRFQNGQWVPIP